MLYKMLPIITDDDDDDSDSQTCAVGSSAFEKASTSPEGIAFFD